MTLNYETLMRHVAEVMPDATVGRAHELILRIIDEDYLSQPLHKIALGNKEVMDFIKAGQKIHAIKVLRTVTGCHLKEAKDAIEHEEVMKAAGVKHGIGGQFEPLKPLLVQKLDKPDYAPVDYSDPIWDE